MLVAVVDRTGRSGSSKVKGTFASVEAAYSARGHTLRWPVSAEVVPIPIMGATKSLRESHTLFISARAVESGVLDGLIAHEMGHMFRTESDHPSHDPSVLAGLADFVTLPRAGTGPFGAAFNHVQDIYADDLAFLVFDANEDGRAYAFFSAWVDGNADRLGSNRWENAGLSASNGFALGNLERHGLLSADDDLWDRARAFDEAAGIEAVDRFAMFYRSLPESPTRQAFLARVQDLAKLFTDAARSR